MSITPIGQDATWSIGQQTVQRHHPSFTNTASLLGLSSTDLTSQLQSGTTLADLAKQKGVSSSDLLASVEKDLKSNAPQGAQAPSDSQLQQFATNIINGTPPTPPGSVGAIGNQDGGHAGIGAPPSLSNTASLLGLSSDDLTSQLQSGTTLADLAKQKGVSSSDLLASVEKDLKANAPQGVQAPSDSQLQQFATNIINGTRPSEAGHRAHSNLSSLASELGMDPSVLLQELSSGQDVSQLLGSNTTGYGSSPIDSINGGVAVDEYA